MDLQHYKTVTCRECGKLFHTTTRNRLGLCPPCKLERKHELNHEYLNRMKELENAPFIPKPTVVVDIVQKLKSLNDGYDFFGPPWGFASLGDPYMANRGIRGTKRIAQKESVNSSARENDL